MKSGAPLMAETADLAKARWSAVLMWEVACDLFKARLTSAVVLTTAVSFYMGTTARLDGWLLVRTLLATGLLACGAAAFNEYLERDYDGRMRRTWHRPLPTRRLTPWAAFAAAAGTSAAGLICLSLAVSVGAGVVGFATLTSYLFCYTPLKRMTTLNTLIGAVPGALPAMIGWTSGRGTVWGAGWLLFGIVFLWQIPHFLAIGWMHRVDYGRAGFKIVALHDPDGRRSGRYALVHAICLVPVSICPFLMGMVSGVYLLGAMLLGALIVARSVQFARDPSVGTARRLFHGSVVYLPLLLVLMAATKTGVAAW